MDRRISRLEVSKHVRGAHYDGSFFSALFLFSMLEATGAGESCFDIHLALLLWRDECVVWK